MEQWLKTGIKQVEEVLKNDPEFRRLQEELSRAEEGYLTVVKRLSPEDRETVENYIALCEELEYQRTHTAYRCGKMSS